MPTQTQTEIFMPALMDGGKVIVSQAWLAANVEYRIARGKYRTARGNPLTAAEYQAMNPPALAELRHAYFDKSPDGSFVSPDYRQSVLSNRERGEYTSTFLRDGKEAIERPEKIYFDNKRGLWIAEGGKVSPVELPNEGWTLEYDNPTGFPSRTSRNRKDAEKVFGDDTSYFWSSKSGLSPVVRGFGLFVANFGPFCIDATYGSNHRSSFIGARSCRKLNQAERDVLESMREV